MQGLSGGLSYEVALLLYVGGHMRKRGNPRRTNSSRRNALRTRMLASGEPCWICELSLDRDKPNLDPEQPVLDELVPVAMGGSPYRGDNVRGAHRCCNNWRKTKSIETVQMIKAAIMRGGQAWHSPQQFVILAKAAEVAIKKQAAIGAYSPPRSSTDW